jgi:hypothetical protein
MDTPETFVKCDGCKTDTCGTYWPEDDRHMPGRFRGCFAQKSRSVGLESAGTWAINAADKVMDADNNAYRRLRKDGVQPETVTGSAKLEATLK